MDYQDPMQNILNMLAQNWKYIALLVGFGLLFMIFSIIRNGQKKKISEKYLAEHPDAATVMLGSHTGITQESLLVLEVNGSPPVLFNKGTKGYCYLLPGDNTLSLRYSYTRPGVMYKSVTQNYEGEVTVAVEARKNYVIGYDRKAEQFTFAETE